MVEILDNFDGFTASYLNQVQDIEDVSKALYEERLDLDNTVGEQLDRVGEIPVIQRGDSVDDADYRDRIRSQIVVNTSDGLTEDIYRAVQLFISTDPDSLSLVDEFPAAFSLRLDYGATAIPSLEQFTRVAAIVKKEREAGVQGFVIRFNDLSFKFSDTLGVPTLSSSRGFADDPVTTGGELAGVLEA